MECDAVAASAPRRQWVYGVVSASKVVLEDTEGLLESHAGLALRQVGPC
jgi:hypothetical protein